MGTDNFFHKRKPRKSQRRTAYREEYDKVLIVCEGEKTEPNYFNELINHYKISSANVKVDGSCGSSPKCVFEYAERLYRSEKNKGDAYDRVYCVFDKDTHHTYDETISKIKDKQSFYVVNSVPCFEYWLLLHFNYSTKPYAKKGKSSIANEVLKELKKHIPKYEKGAKNIFKTTMNDLDYAINNAKNSLKQAIQNNTDNPSTNVHKLIEYLSDIKKHNH
jgi:hypothetical protein